MAHLPNDFAAEQAVLATLALKPALAEEVRALLPEPECFFSPKHRAFYAALLALCGRGEGIDRVTVGHELQALGEIRAFNGRDEAERIFMEMCRKSEGVRNVQSHVRIVHKCWALRKAAWLLGQHSDEAGLGEREITEILNDAQKTLVGLTGIADNRPTLQFGDVADDVVTDTLDRAEEARQLADGGMLGLPTGIPGLSELISGLKPASFVLLAGRPGEGKSTVMMQMADAIAASAPARFNDDREAGGVHVVSLEMTARELVAKTVYGDAGVDSQKADSGELDDDQLVQVEQAAHRLSGRRVFIDDLSGPSWAQVRARIILARERYGTEVAFIDHLLEIPTPPRTKRREHVSAIALECKKLARQLDIPIVGLTQLRRAGGRSKKPPRPTKEDLGESSDLERRADQIILLWPRGGTLKTSEDATGNLMDPENQHVTERLDFIVEKNRGGRTGDVNTVFNKTLGRIVPKPTAQAEFRKQMSEPDTRYEREEKEPQI